MMPLVALCADEVSLAHPELIGLEGESLSTQRWMRLFTSGSDMRDFLNSTRDADEAWIVSCGDVEPINLAATLKKDHHDLRVCLVSFQGTGSLFSRASAAGIDATLTRQAFVTRYGAFKRTRSENSLLDQVEGAAEGSTDPGSSGSFQPAEPPEIALSPSHSAWCSTAESEDVRSIQQSQVVAKPALRPFELPAVEKMLGASTSQAFLLPVVSGSGGAGKSTVAALAAIIAQRRGHKTLLLDFDLQFGDMRELLGQPEAPGIDDVLADPARLAQLQSSAAGMPALLGAPRHLEDSESIAQQAAGLIDALLAQFDVVIANTGAAWAEQHAVLLERCSKALFLIDQRASSLRACRRALDLCSRCGIAASPFMFAVNFCAKGAPFTSIDASCALRGAEVLELADGGVEVEEVASEGRLFELVELGNPLCQSVSSFLSGVLPATEGAAEDDVASASSFGMLFRRRRRRRRGVA